MRARIAAVAALLVCGVLASQALAASRTVRVGDDWFVRDSSGTPSVTVERNTTVVWRWVGDNTHNVRVTSGPVKFASSYKTSGTYRKKVTRTGTYRIVCSIHAGDMKMTLRVTR